MRLKYRALSLAGAILASSVDGPMATAADVQLYPPHVYPVAYEHLNRWCGPDALIINTADGQVLLRLDLIERERTIFNDPLDPVLLDSGLLATEAIGCHLDSDFHLTYWQAGDYLSFHRLKKDPGAWWTADDFVRREFVRLPSGFDSAALRDRGLFLSYLRPCLVGAAEATVDWEYCAGLERIDLETLDRTSVLERHGVTVDRGAATSDVKVIQNATPVTAVIVDEKRTEFCRIDEDNLALDCRLAVGRPIRKAYEGEYRRLTIGVSPGAFYELGEHLLYCDGWDKAASDAPMCRVVVPQIESQTDAGVRLRAILPNGQALVQADHCLSIGEISPQSGIVRRARCLLEPIREVASKVLRLALVDEEPFAGEHDGVTIPRWDLSISPTEKWIAIQVPHKGCGDNVPRPETEEPNVSVGSCGQVMIWRLDRFVR